jgi:phenylacetate-CoA ligase
MISIPTAQEAVIIAMQHRLKQSEGLHPAQHSGLQQKSIQTLLQHALNTVPYYQNHPDIIAMKGDIQWDKFPILTRAELQKNEQKLLSNAPPASHGKHYDFRSSGSTGRPVHTKSTEFAQVFWQALTFRDHIWADRNLNGSLAAIKFLPADRARFPGTRSNRWGISPAAFGFHSPSILLNSSEPIEVQYRWLCEQQPNYLVTYPSILQELAKIQLRDKKLDSLHNVCCIGENLPPSLRQLTLDAFGCRIHDIYSSQEVGYMALQCPKSDKYHIQLENCLLEVLDENNQPCIPGQMGRVVVTPLHNYLMPLIRYEIGDYAIAGNQNCGCDCGITLPVLDRIIGRTRNLVSYPNGNKSWPAYNPMALMKLFPQSSFQIEQLNLEELQFNLQSPSKPSDSDCDKACTIIREAIGHDFRISVQHVKKLERSSGGKFEEFISRI